MKIDHEKRDHQKSNRWILASRRLIVPGREHVHPMGEPGRVWIEGEKIAQIELGLNLPPTGLAEVDYGDLVVMPGVVDTHAHINEPGRTDWEGFDTATWGAATGGVSTVVDMPLNCIPATTTLAALELKVKEANGKCHIDYGFWGGVIPGNSAELEPMVRAGALGFKAFMIDSGVDEFPPVTEQDLLEAMPILARLGVPLLLHAELDCGTVSASSRDPSFQDPGSCHDPRKYSDYVKSRPVRWETAAIEMAIRLAEKTKCHVHIVHLSAADALPIIEAARKRGIPITVETCGHYLSFCEEEIPDGATEFKCAPPIRDRENRERLWKGLREGAIDQIVSDHSPCAPGLKLKELGDFQKAWGGIAGLQLGLSTVWTEARKRGFSAADLVRWQAERPAWLAGLQDQKGAIAVGRDADLVIWNPEASFRFDVKSADPSGPVWRHRHPLTPYSGRVYQGRVVALFVRGTLRVENDRLVDRAGGRWVRQKGTKAGHLIVKTGSHL